MIILGFFSFLLGTIYGSFLNMLLWRLPKGDSLGGRSRCRHCHHTLNWFDLIPVVSFILTKGTCRYCKKTIDPQYLIVELVCGLVVFMYGFGLQLTNPITIILGIYELLSLLGLFFFDTIYMILPDVIMVPSIIIFGVYDFLSQPDPISFFLTGLSIAAFFGILYVVSKGRWIGFGDIKLGILMGLIFDYPFGLLATIAGIWGGSLIAAVLLITKRATRNTALPLGAFITAAAILLLLFYDHLQFFAYYFR